MLMPPYEMLWKQRSPSCNTTMPPRHVQRRTWFPIEIHQWNGHGPILLLFSTETIDKLGRLLGAGLPLWGPLSALQQGGKAEGKVESKGNDGDHGRREGARGIKCV